jgi:hypothetical protein
MKKIKISSLWNATVDLKSNVILSLIKNLSKKDIEFTSIKDCDILLFGPFENQSILHSIKRKFIEKFKKKINGVEKIFPNIDFYLLNRKIKPLRIFLSWENFQFPNIKYDFAITSFLGINNENHLRFPLWKNLVDWTHLDLAREMDPYIKRFDTYYKIEDLTKPQGEDFIKKPKKMCLISSHLNEPRKSIYHSFKKNFEVDGYGPIFDKKIKDHYSNPITKKEILKNYAFNLCPENSLYPGYYTEKIPEAFLSKCLPITWADKNVSNDFNDKSFINLLNYSIDNYSEIMNLINDTNFLKPFTNEPLLLISPNLNNEIKFAQKIIDCL